jgi:hypothetical protein
MLERDHIPYRFFDKNDDKQLMSITFYEGIAVCHDNHESFILFRSMTFWGRANVESGISFDTDFYNDVFLAQIKIG